MGDGEKKTLVRIRGGWRGEDWRGYLGGGWREEDIGEERRGWRGADIGKEKERWGEGKVEGGWSGEDNVETGQSGGRMEGK